MGHSLLCRLAESLRAARLSTNLARTSVLSAYSGQLYRLTTSPPIVGPPRPYVQRGAPRARRDLRPAWPVILLRIPGDRRLLAGISGRFSCGICAGWKEAGGRYVKTSVDLQAFYASDGTRTRDPRRDRPSQAERRPTASRRPSFAGAFRSEIDSAPHG